MEQRVEIYSERKSSRLQTIIWAGLTAGLLDAMAASTMFNIKLGLNPWQVMQYVASAIYGPSALTGGIPMVIIGTLLHFLMAFIIAAIYLYAYLILIILSSAPFLSGLALGLGAWLVMNLLVVQLSKTTPVPLVVSDVIVGFLWLML